jgi:hypothetical protein
VTACFRRATPTRRSRFELETHDAGIGDVFNGSSVQLGGPVQELLEELGYRK